MDSAALNHNRNLTNHPSPGVEGETRLNRREGSPLPKALNLLTAVANWLTCNKDPGAWLPAGSTAKSSRAPAPPLICCCVAFNTTPEPQVYFVKWGPKSSPFHHGAITIREEPVAPGTRVLPMDFGHLVSPTVRSPHHRSDF